MTRRNKNIGDWGEERACEFLHRHGFRVVGRNFHTTTGEIDIIAIKGDDYYFIEVKTRMQNEMANDQSITFFKKIRLQKAVKAYCYKNSISGSIVLAGLILAVNKSQNKVNFRFCVFC